MHELSVARSVLREAEAIAGRNGAARVVTITLRRGHLCAMSDDVLREHLTEAARGTVAEGAQFEMLTDTGMTMDAQELMLESIEIEVD